jgi:hypothetical protein
MKTNFVGMSAVALSAGLIGCTSSGLSTREVPGRDHGTYVRAIYDRAEAPDLRSHMRGVYRGPATAEAALARPFVAPAKVAVFQVGEVSPDEIFLATLRKAPDTFTRVEAISDAGGDVHVRRRDPHNHDAPLENANQRLVTLTRVARDMGMDYMLMIGGTIESQQNSTPLSILNLTIIGAFIIPSDQTRALAKASGYLIDVHTGRVVAVSSAQAQGGQLTPAVSTRAESVIFQRKLRTEVTAKLAEQVVLDCRGMKP